MIDETFLKIIDDIRNENINFGECTISITYRNKQIQKYSITSTKSVLINKRIHDSKETQTYYGEKL